VSGLLDRIKGGRTDLVFFLRSTRTGGRWRPTCSERPWGLRPIAP